MAYKLKMNHPDLPEGTPFDLGGILVINGETVTLTAEDEARIYARHGTSVKEALGNSQFVEISGGKSSNVEEGGEG